MTRNRSRVSLALLASIIAAAFVATPARAVPMNVTIDGISYFADDFLIENGATVMGYDASAGSDVVIPDIVYITGQPYRVTAVNVSAFANKALTSLTLGSHVRTIGDSAFAHNNLTSVDIPASVLWIGNGAFANSGLTNITFHEGLQGVGELAFGSTALGAVTLPGSVTGLAPRAFEGAGISSLVLPDGLASIPRSAFRNNPMTTVQLPSGLVSIGDMAFENTALTSLTIPEGVTTIGFAAFRGASLTSLSLPDSLNFIGEYSFAGNDLTEVSIPGGVKTISYSAFASNDLTTVNLAEGVTRVATHAFKNNPFSSIVLPASITQIDSVAFDTNPLTQVTMLGPAPFVGTHGLGNSDPLVTYYQRYAGSGYTSPTWDTGDDTWRTQALVQLAFDANGHGTAPSARDVNLGGTTAEPAALSATGYTFAGWFDSPAGGSEFDFDAALTSDTTAYAQWTINTYDVTFEPGNGNASWFESVDYNTTVAAPSDPARGGYTFAGWFTAATGGAEFDFQAPITAATTVYAQWADVPAALEAPSDVAPGDSITVTGKGFAPGEELQLWFLSSPVLLTTVTADAAGTFAAEVTIPAEATAGTHHLEVRSASSEPVSSEVEVAAVLATTGWNGTWTAASAAALLALGGALVLARRRIGTHA
ncbi:leucine-rich repeat protein [Demequina sp. NBRC 110052]|uniref:leucine-rich repeat protein n=1 Tax=Demequina sp. NBRC 110052 TaxID=1570341 RepID=UPI000A01EDED|nr:leucine-rich repeat protein [Demequina sp. NBRC 110052]